MNDLILFGMQGSGKGTQAEFLIQKYGFVKMETGKILRTMAAEDNELGRKIKAIQEAGELVPDDILKQILDTFITETEQTNHPIIFDGFPRTQQQIDDLDDVFAQHNRSYIAMLIEISEQESVKRIATRKICPTCKDNYPVFYEKDSCGKCGDIKLIQREDDRNKDVVMKRIELYKTQTLPIIETLREKGKCITINGEQSIEDVRDDIGQALEHNSSL